jgi:hypothetical protein
MTIKHKKFLFVVAGLIIVVVVGVYIYERYTHLAKNVTATVVMLQAKGPVCFGSTVTEINDDKQSDTICPKFNEKDYENLSSSPLGLEGKYRIVGKAYITTERLQGGTGKRYATKVMYFTEVEKSEKLSSSVFP